MIYTEKMTIHTEKNGVISITNSVEKALNNSGIKNGILVVETPHSTAGIVRATEKAISSHKDLLQEVKRLIPSRVDFIHKESPDDAAGHIKSALFGTSVSAVVKDGGLAAEQKLGYFFMEYYGPRKRDIYISIVGE